MAIVVRPSARWVRAREMRTSVSASTDDVASSSTSTSGSATPARSRATSWRSPADSSSPRSPTPVISPSGIPATHSSSSSRLTTASMSSSEVPGRAKPTLAAIVALNRNGSWETTTSRVRRSSFDTYRNGTSPTRISPIVGSARRAINRPSVVLPEPVAPTSATCWPAGMCAVTWRSTASSVAAASPRVG